LIITSVKSLGGLIRQRRLDLGLSQTQLANAAGVSRPWVSELEGGKTSAAVGLVLVVTDVLGLQINIATTQFARAQAPGDQRASADRRTGLGAPRGTETSRRLGVRPAVGKSVSPGSARNASRGPKRDGASKKTASTAGSSSGRPVRSTGTADREKGLGAARPPITRAGKPLVASRGRSAAKPANPKASKR